MRGRAIRYEPEEIAWLAERAEWPRADLHRAFCNFWHRNDVSLANFKALCKRHNIMTGRTGYFVKGQEPKNKGKPMSAEVRARASATMFKPGNRTGFASQLYQPIGTERVSKDGYLERKIHDGLPLQSRWRAVHLVRWEANNGPVPEGHALKCLDGNRLNTDPANWEAIPRGMLPRLNGRRGRGYDNAPAELKPAIMALAKLEHRVRGVKE